MNSFTGSFQTWFMIYDFHEDSTKTLFAEHS